MADKRKEKDWVTRVFDYLSLPSLVLRPDKLIVDANRSFLEKFAVKKENVVRRTCHEFFYNSQEPCPLETCALSNVLTNRRGSTVLKLVRSKAGKEKWYNRVFSPILDDSGEVSYIIESIYDVTQLKLLERKLSGAKDFTQKLIQSSATAIIAADPRGRLLTMNPAAEELIGYSLKEAQERITTKDLYPPGQAKEIMRIMRDEGMGGKGKLHLRQSTLMHPSGEEIPVDLTAAIIYEGEREVATVGLFNDLREKIKQEQAMREMLVRIARAEKMASLGQLAAGVAHEINNPLTGIIFYANLLLDTLDADDPRRASLTYIYEDAKRCGRIIKNLLTYSRQTTPAKEILHVNSIVEHGLDLIRDRKFFMGVRILKDFSVDMMLIEGDRDQLGQVIVNLVLNAFDAMEQHGTLTLRTYPDKSAGMAFIEVSDTGKGIPKENVGLIFDPFFTTKAAGKGTGLGLSTAYGILKDNGGAISVKETSNKGTTFLVELPLYRSAESGDCTREQ